MFQCAPPSRHSAHPFCHHRALPHRTLSDYHHPSSERRRHRIIGMRHIHENCTSFQSSAAHSCPYQLLCCPGRGLRVRCPTVLIYLQYHSRTGEGALLHVDGLDSTPVLIQRQSLAIRLVFVACGAPGGTRGVPSNCQIAATR